MAPNPMQVTVETPDTDQLERDSLTALDTAKAIVITDDGTYQGAAGMLKLVKGRYNELEALRKAITKPLDEAKRNVMDMFRIPLERLKGAEGATKQSMLAYQREQETKRRAEQARLQEIARKEREKLERQAARAEKSGREEKAEDLRQVADSLPDPVVAHAAPKISGLSTRKIYKARVTDKMALIKAVAEGKAPDILLEPNMSALNGQARALKEAFNYPGVELISDDTMAARAS